MTNLNLSDEDEERLDRVADKISNGNRTEAVRKMVALFDSGEALCEATQHADARPREATSNEPVDYQQEIADAMMDADDVDLDFFREQVDRYDAKEWQVICIGRYIEGAGMYMAKSEVVKAVKQVLDCHRTTAYDWVDRLEAEGWVEPSPVATVEVDEVREAYDCNDAEEHFVAKAKHRNALDDASDITDLVDLPHGMDEYILGSGYRVEVHEDLIEACKQDMDRLSFAVMVACDDYTDRSFVDYL